jgi:hypothetical protein
VGGDRPAYRRLGQVGPNELPRWPGPDKVEVGWDLHPSVWGQGLATEGAWAALGYGFEVVGLERIISTARADNAASRRVMEKCGLAFQEEFTHKGALVAWYAIDRAGWQAGQAAASRSVASLDGLVGPAVTQGRAAAGRRAPRRASVHRQRPGHA